MSLARTCRGLLQKLKPFYLMNLVYYCGGIKGMCGAAKPLDFDSVNVKPGHFGTTSGKEHLDLPGTPSRVGTRVDLFHERKPKFVSPEQWAEWERRYGFAPLGEFCDSCRRVPGKCRYLESCQDYCAEDCYGHGKDFTVSILCSWCEGAREDRCRDWRSCRDHCKILCLHERYKLKVEADLKTEEKQARQYHRQLYEKYLRKKEEEDRMWVEKQEMVRRGELEKIRKELAKRAQLEHRPPRDEF